MINLAAFESGFQHATHGVVADLFVTVLVAQMNLHSRDVIAESAQDARHDASDLGDQRASWVSML